MKIGIDQQGKVWMVGNAIPATFNGIALSEHLLTADQVVEYETLTRPSDRSSFVVFDGKGFSVTLADLTAGDFQAAVQQHLDAAARARGYDDIRSAVTYAEEPAVPAFQAEGQALRAWRSRVWAACYGILAEVQAGTRSAPASVAELIGELPAAPSF